MRSRSQYSIIFLLIVSCAGSQPQSDEPSVETVPSCATWDRAVRNNLWGYRDQNRNVMIDYQFKEAYSFDGEIAKVVLDNDSTYLIDCTGSIITDFGFTEIKDFEGKSLSYGWIGGERTGDYYFIDRSGRIRPQRFGYIAFHYSSKTFVTLVDCDTCSLELMSQLYDSTGNAISGLYEKMVPIHNDSMLYVCDQKEDPSKVALMNPQGEIVSNWYDDLQRKRRFGVFQVYIEDGRDRKLGLVAASGQEIIPPIYDEINDHSDHGVIELLTDPPNYHSMATRYLLDTNFNDLNYSVKNPVKYLANSNLIGIESSGHRYALHRVEGGEIVKVSKEYDLVKESKSRRQLFLFIFEMNSYRHWDVYNYPYFHRGRAIVLKNNKWGAVDSTGAEIIPPEYDSIFHLEDGQLKAWKAGESKMIK